MNQRYLDDALRKRHDLVIEAVASVLGHRPRFPEDKFRWTTKQNGNRTDILVDDKVIGTVVMTVPDMIISQDQIRVSYLPK